MFSWEAPKGRPGEQSIVGKMHCLEKKLATKAESGTKKFKIFLFFFLGLGLHRC